MSLLKWDTFGALEEVLNRLKRTFWRYPAEKLAARDWVPTIKISQTGTAYLIKAEIPEVKKEDVRVTIQNGMLTIEGECKPVKQGRDKKLGHVRSRDSFVQSFRMPDDTDEATVDTEFKDGMVSVTLHKTQMINSPKASTRAINIPVG